MLELKTWQRPRICCKSHYKATTENLAKSAKNLEEVKSWPVLKREKKTASEKNKKPMPKILTSICGWLRLLKSLSHNIKWTTTKLHQIFENLSWFNS